MKELLYIITRIGVKATHLQVCFLCLNIMAKAEKEEI